METKNNNKLYIGFGFLAAILLGACMLATGFLVYNMITPDTNNVVLNESNNNVPESVNEADAPSDEGNMATNEIEETDSSEPDEASERAEDLGTLFTPFWETRDLLNNYFVDQPLDDAVLAQGAIDGLAYALEKYEIELDSVVLPDDAQDIATLAESANTPSEIIEIYTSFWEAWQKASYVAIDYEDLTPTQLLQESLAWMVASLGDQHTSYMDPDQFRQTQISLDGSYEGIGAWVDSSTEYLTIISPMQDSPAEQSGLEPGDRVIAVDGDDMTGIDASLVIRRVLGPAGSTVILTIERDGIEEHFDVSITRATIVVPTVEYEVYENGLGYVHLYGFGANSYEEFHAALATVMAENPTGLIIDLRNNGGGYLNAAVDITSEFIEEGVILYEEYGDGTRDIYEANGGGLATSDIPLVILVNEGTASASEILTGAVMDYGRGTVIGTTTFGKGSVQITATLSEEQGALRVTIARWLTPNELHIHKIGIEPDILVEITEEDAEAQNDVQLQAAFDFLLDQ